MATVNMSIRVDTQLKKQADMMFADMGLNMSTAMNMFLRQVVRQGKIPFEISTDPFYSEANMRYLNNVISDIESGKAKLVEHSLIEADD